MHMNSVLILSSYLHLVLSSKLISAGFPPSAIKFILINIVLLELSEEACACAELLFVRFCRLRTCLLQNVNLRISDLQQWM
jgi:hypothetical protein